MSFLAFSAKIGSAAAKLAGFLFAIVLIAQLMPSGPIERLFAAIDASGVADGAAPSGAIR